MHYRLNDEQYRQLAAVAKSLNMGFWTEAISEEEINRKLHWEPKLLASTTVTCVI